MYGMRANGETKNKRMAKEQCRRKRLERREGKGDCLPIWLGVKWRYTTITTMRPGIEEGTRFWLHFQSNMSRQKGEPRKAS